ncbi:MAG: metallophosphoesterase [Patescibacteria group bacterium]
MEKILLNIIYYIFYLLFPAIFIIASRLYIKKSKGEPIVELVVLLIICLILVWVRFIEPNLIKTRYYNVQKNNSEKQIRLAVFSDVHIGVYSSEKMLERIAKKVSELNVDIVVMPGDFVYYANKDKMKNYFSSLRSMEKIKVAVLGNHDYDREGYVKANEISSALRSEGVIMIDNEKKIIEIGNKKIEFIGIEDLWTGNPDYSILEKKDSDTEVDLRFLVTHNPDTIYELNKEVSNIKEIDLMLAGHTHAGQLRIPYIYKYVIPSNHEFDKGFYNINNIDIFVTSGIGNVVLPMRLFNRPEISIIDVSF